MIFRIFSNLFKERPEVVQPKDMPDVQLRVYPTRMRLPMWSGGVKLRTALSSFRIVDHKVSRISPDFEPKKGLCRVAFAPEIEPTISPEPLVDKLSREIPVDGTEIVEWMHVSAAEKIVMQQRIAEYNRLGSEVAGANGDPKIPGVVIEDLSYRSQTGSEVGRQGYGIAVSPRGYFNVPVYGKTAGIFSDYLSWGSISNVYTFQWCASLLKWRSLAETPIYQRVGFYSDYRGNVAPNFFAQIPVSPRPRATVTLVMSTNDSQTVTINFRDPTNYTRVLGTRQLDMASGQNSLTFTLSAFPFVPPVCSEIQPEDKKQTTLDSYTVA